MGQWGGAVKFHGEDGHVAVSIGIVLNVVTHGCTDRSPADPPVGPTVEDLVTALSDLEPFHVTSAPADVTRYGLPGHASGADRARPAGRGSGRAR